MSTTFKSTTTVTHPDGSVCRRTSKSMTYTHAIVRVTRYADLRKEMELGIDRNIALAAKYARLGDLDVANRCSAYAERDFNRLAEMPESGSIYVVVSWSQSKASADKRVKPERGQYVVAVDPA